MRLQYTSTIAVVLLVLWLLGLVTSFTAGGLLHVLLVVAVIMDIFQLVSGRRVGQSMTIHAGLTPLISLAAGILVLVVPKLLNFIVAVYLIVIGIVGLIGGSALRI